MRGRIAAVLIAATLLLPAIAGASGNRFWAPMLALPRPIRAHFACIMKAESRSTFQHLNVGDNNRYGSSGIFQIEQSTWAAHQSAAGVPARIHVWQASPYQQELVAIAIWKANGFGQWDRYDGC